MNRRKKHFWGCVNAGILAVRLPQFRAPATNMFYPCLALRMFKKVARVLYAGSSAKTQAGAGVDSEILAVRHP